VTFSPRRRWTTSRQRTGADSSSSWTSMLVPLIASTTMESDRVAPTAGWPEEIQPGGPAPVGRGFLHGDGRGSSQTTMGALTGARLIAQVVAARAKEAVNSVLPRRSASNGVPALALARESAATTPGTDCRFHFIMRVAVLERRVLSRSSSSTGLPPPPEVRTRRWRRWRGPTTPSERPRSSTFLVETPSTYASATPGHATSP
jgi:hypothetical protein